MGGLYNLQVGAPPLQELSAVIADIPESTKQSQSSPRNLDSTIVGYSRSFL